MYSVVFQNQFGVVGWCEGVMYLSYRGIQLILAYSWARPAILIADKGRGRMFLFLLFLHFHSCSSFFPVPLFHLFYYLFYLFSPFLWEMAQNDPQGLTCHLTPTQSISFQNQYRAKFLLCQCRLEILSGGIVLEIFIYFYSNISSIIIQSQ